MLPDATASFQTKTPVKVEADDSIVSIRSASTPLHLAAVHEEGLSQRSNFWSSSTSQKLRTMAPPPGPYSSKSSLAMVARASLFTFGIVYRTVKLKYLKMNTKSQKKAEAKGHH
ncbi:hypothetical protein ACS0TY_028907 [Phlomoides rotata]